MKDQNYASDDFLQFLGWYVAEGCTNLNRGEIAIAYNYKSRREYDTIITILDNLNIEQSSDFESKIGIIKIYDKVLGKWLFSECGHLAPNKKCPNFIKTLSPRQIRLFLQSLYQGDGHKAETSHILTTTSEKLKNDVQELILKEGGISRAYPPRMRGVGGLKNGKKIISKHLTYEINWMHESRPHQTQEKGLSKSSSEKIIKDYNGMVYCVTVPQNIIYVRRNGKPIWCGNSLRFYLTGSTEKMQKAILSAERKSYKTCEHCGKPGKPNKDGWIRTLCVGCRRKENKPNAKS